MNKTSTADGAPWDVLLIGGASGTGKSSLSYPLARHFAVTVTEIDDLHAAVHSMTTAEQQPVLHYWDTEGANLSAERILDLHCSVCRTLEPAIDAVVANHVASRTPVILEGDYLLPQAAHRLMRTYPEQLQAIFLHEGDERQIVQNFLSREPAEGEQLGRAQVSWLFGKWIEEECDRLGLIALSARPWDTLVERVSSVLGTPLPGRDLLS